MARVVIPQCVWLRSTALEGVPNKTTTKGISLIGHGALPVGGPTQRRAPRPLSTLSLSLSLPCPRQLAKKRVALRCARCARTAGRCRPLGRFQHRRAAESPPATPAKKGARQGGRTGGPLLQRSQCRVSIGRAAPLSLEEVCE